jgi:hypothetical protein
MRPRFAQFALAIVSLACFPGSTEAQAPKPTAAITVAEADADFPLQGEFTGDIQIDGQAVKYGARVIAMGKGNFRVVGYPGGLPGDGYAGAERVELESAVQNGRVQFSHDDVVSLLRDGAITITAGGNEIGVLKKVERKSPTLGMKPPTGATVLFDGSTAENFNGGKKTDDGLLVQGATSKLTHQDVTVHLEFQLSYMPTATGQARANSGCYLQGRYEVQILDSFGLAGKNNECGGLYEIKDPELNMCYPPLAWQSYDIDFTAAKFGSDGKKTADAQITVKHNGVTIHKDVALPRSTRASPLPEGAEPGPLYLQDHGNPIRFRNIWVVKK